MSQSPLLTKITLKSTSSSTIIPTDYTIQVTGNPQLQDQQQQQQQQVSSFHHHQKQQQLWSHPDVEYRQVPPYRPINKFLDKNSRPWGSNPVETVFVFTMFQGVWLKSTASWLWRVLNRTIPRFLVPCYILVRNVLPLDHRTLVMTLLDIKTPPIRDDLHQVFPDKENNLTFHKNVSIPLKHSPLPIRANIYIPLSPQSPDDQESRYPVLVTYGPYGKDIPYASFHPASFAQVNPEHKSKYSAWETPDPVYWCRQGYAVVRADERGLGQSPGLLDTMSRGTSDCFFEVIEWCAEQEWSTGKVGLLGVSYYAGSQWRVAARNPKGLAAIVPWEGMSDYYRDRCRHGGILSNKFISLWYQRQVLINQYGLPGRSTLKLPSASNYGPGATGQEDTIEGDLPPDVLLANRRDQTVDNEANYFLDDDYYASKDYQLEDIKVPLLSVANWGGILLHLRGNILGYTQAGSEFKYLRCITGRHDLPFYYKEEVEVQKSFLDAFLKGNDTAGWTKPGQMPPVTMTIRKGDNVGYNDAEKERAAYEKRAENEWPIARTEYKRFFLDADGGLSEDGKDGGGGKEKRTVTYQALGTLDNPQAVQFTTAPFEEEMEITGHIVAHVNVSVTPASSSTQSPDIDLFLTLRHFSANKTEIYYTGTAGDPVPLCKGWLRVSNRKVNTKSKYNKPWFPHREYLSTDVLQVKAGEVYDVDVEMWPTNVVVGKGERIVFEVSSGDTQGSGVFQHCSEVDRYVCGFSLLFPCSFQKSVVAFFGLVLARTIVFIYPAPLIVLLTQM
ncbi:putative serine esterase [Rhypophila decipiens]